MQYSQRITITILLLSSMFFAVPALASSVRQLDVNELLAGSELVFEGKVLSKQVRWNDTKTDIFTILTFTVEDVIHGTYVQPELTLSFVGGQIDEFRVKIEGSIIPDVGEHGIYFIESITRSLLNPLLGWTQGHLLIKTDASGRQRMYTHDESPIMAMDVTQKKKQFISEGTMTGLKLGSRLSKDASGAERVAADGSALTADDFKASLRAQMNALKLSQPTQK